MATSKKQSPGNIVKMRQMIAANPDVVVPHAPGVYEFSDGTGQIIYVGKANSLRRRLGQYSKPPRGKRGRKMRAIVSDAATLCWTICASELEALELELKKIQELRPRHNVSGAFFFLYPFIGVDAKSRDVTFCFSTCQEQTTGMELFGAFRSRPMAMAAFEAITELAGYFGHRQRRLTSDRAQDKPYSIYAVFRQLPPMIRDGVPRFLLGDKTWLGQVSMALLDKPAACRDAKSVQDWLEALDVFFDSEVQPLLTAMRQQGLSYPVDQKDLDLIKLRSRLSDHHV